MKQSKIAVIIPIYNLWKEMTLPCLQSLLEHRTEEIHIYLIDNASSDVSAEEIVHVGTELFGNKFTYHRFEKNLGFAIACNQGAKLAQKDGNEFLFFLNNDTLLTHNCLLPLLQAFDNPKIGALSPLLLFPQNQKVQHAGVSLNPLGGMRHIYYNFPANHPLVLKNRYLHYISGAAFLIRTSLFMELGLFCEDFVNGLEDIDLCCRISNAGYLLKVVPESIIYHYASQSLGRMDANAANFKVFERRQPELVYDDPFISKKDNYIPILTKEMQYCAVLPHEKAQQYTKAMQSRFSPEACEKVLEREPLWIDGYDMLATYYEEQNMPSKVCYLRELAVSFYPSRENFEKLIASLKKYGEKERAEIFQNQLDTIMQKKNDIHYQDEIRQHFEKLAKSDSIYQELYENRL